jgi:hypothetical protein
VELERWREIECVYRSAQERSADDRGEFLREACANDPELRREVESLLRHGESAGTFLERQALHVAAS